MKRHFVIVLATLALAASMLPAALVAACPIDVEVCDSDVGPIGPVGPQGPDAIYDSNTELYLFVDGSTSDVYDPPTWHQPTLQDYWERTLYVIEHLFDDINRYAPNPGSDGCCAIRG